MDMTPIESALSCRSELQPTDGLDRLQLLRCPHGPNFTPFLVSFAVVLNRFVGPCEAVLWVLL